MKYDKLTEKKERLEGFYPLPDALTRSLDDWLRVELTYASNAIEGNTLTRRETALVVEKGLTVGGKSLVEHLEAVNHARALDWIKEQSKRKPDSLTEKDILHIHNFILEGIDDANAGHYRTIPVRIAGAPVILPNPRKVPELMADFVAWLGRSKKWHPVELAAEAHYRLVTIHPFTDGNGRTARLLMNMILLMTGYPLAIIRKRDRLAYISALEKAQRGGAKDDYLQIIVKAVNRSLDIYLKAALGEHDTQWDKQWGEQWGEQRGGLSAGQSASERLLKIGELAKQAGVRNSTIRYWTKKGLLETAAKTKAGYMLYAPDMTKRIKKIHALKKKRFTLQEIKDKISSG